MNFVFHFTEPILDCACTICLDSQTSTLWFILVVGVNRFMTLCSSGWCRPSLSRYGRQTKTCASDSFQSHSVPQPTLNFAVNGTLMITSLDSNCCWTWHFLWPTIVGGEGPHSDPVALFNNQPNHHDCLNSWRLYREEENLVFCFGALFNSTLNFTQSGWLIPFSPDLHFRLAKRVSGQTHSSSAGDGDQNGRVSGRPCFAMLFS